MIYSDAFVRIAAGKAVCQDAVSHGASGTEQRGLRFAVQADGCSTAEHSEAGAELLVKALGDYLYPGCNFNFAMMAACGYADAARRVRDFSRDSLHATIQCVVQDGVNFRIASGGDGFQVLRRRGTHTYEIYYCEYTKNAPLYPAYLLNYDALKYREVSNQTFNTVQYHSAFLDLEGDFVDNIGLLPMSPGDQKPCYEFTRRVEDYDLAMVFSDGLASFKPEDSEDLVPLEEVLRLFLPFKTTQGAFLQRRMDFAFREAVKRGWKNVDDFSVAGLSDVV